MRILLALLCLLTLAACVRSERKLNSPAVQLSAENLRLYGAPPQCSRFTMPADEAARLRESLGPMGDTFPEGTCETDASLWRYRLDYRKINAGARSGEYDALVAMCWIAVLTDAAAAWCLNIDLAEVALEVGEQPLVQALNELTDAARIQALDALFLGLVELVMTVDQFKYEGNPQDRPHRPLNAMPTRFPQLWNAWIASSRSSKKYREYFQS